MWNWHPWSQLFMGHISEGFIFLLLVAHVHRAMQNGRIAKFGFEKVLVFLVTRIESDDRRSQFSRVPRSVHAQRVPPHTQWRCGKPSHTDHDLDSPRWHQFDYELMRWFLEPPTAAAGSFKNSASVKWFHFWHICVSLLYQSAEREPLAQRFLTWYLLRLIRCFVSVHPSAALLRESTSEDNPRRRIPTSPLPTPISFSQSSALPSVGGRGQKSLVSTWVNSVLECWRLCMWRSRYKFHRLGFRANVHKWINDKMRRMCQAMEFRTSFCYS